MIGLDTDVLIRYVVQDDDEQTSFYRSSTDPRTRVASARAGA